MSSVSTNAKTSLSFSARGRSAECHSDGATRKWWRHGLQVAASISQTESVLSGPALCYKGWVNPKCRVTAIFSICTPFVRNYPLYPLYPLYAIFFNLYTLVLGKPSSAKFPRFFFVCLFVNFRQYPDHFRPFLDIFWPFPDISWHFLTISWPYP